MRVNGKRYPLSFLGAMFLAAALPAWSQTGDQPPSSPPSAPRASSQGVGPKASARGGEQGQPSPAPAQSAPSSVPRPEDLEPGVNTSSAAAPTERAPPATTAGSTPRDEPRAPSKGAASARVSTPPGKAQDRLELDTTQITGNRELPKVLYIVPWKRSDLGDLVGKPVNSLVDEVLAPVDRDVFTRQNRYYDALKPDAAKAAAGTAPEPGKRP